MTISVLGVDDPDSGVTVYTHDAAGTSHAYEFTMVDESTLRLVRREFRLKRLPSGEWSPKTPHVATRSVRSRLAEEGFKVVSDDE